MRKHIRRLVLLLRTSAGESQSLRKKCVRPPSNPVAQLAWCPATTAGAPTCHEWNSVSVEAQPTVNEVIVLEPDEEMCETAAPDNEKTEVMTQPTEEEQSDLNSGLKRKRSDEDASSLDTSTLENRDLLQKVESLESENKELRKRLLEEKTLTTTLATLVDVVKKLEQCLPDQKSSREDNTSEKSFQGKSPAKFKEKCQELLKEPTKTRQRRQLGEDWPCGAVSSEETCWLCDDFPAWNSVIHAFDLELAETAPGTLRLRFQPNSRKEDLVTAAREASVLLSSLLSDHICIQEVHLECVLSTNTPAPEPLFPISMRRRSSSPASRSLRSLRITESGSLLFRYCPANASVHLDLRDMDAVIDLQTLYIAIGRFSQCFAAEMDALLERNRNTLKNVEIAEFRPGAEQTHNGRTSGILQVPDS
ncbi:hypothetical protein MTO96_022835 [Rhipicephalus appendiculatus]